MFHRPSFSPISFSSISFNGASQPVVQEGRSGYWRLFFTQLQEQSEENVVVDTKATAQDTGVVVVKTVVTKPKTKRVVEIVIPEVEYTEPPFRPLPMYRREKVVHNDNIAIRQFQDDIQRMYVQFTKISIELKINLDAANDEDDVELLLLVA